MPPTSAHIQPVADAIGAVLRTVPDLKVYVWAPQDLDEVPAAVILPPTTRRPEPDETDLVGLGTIGLVLEYPVWLFFDLSETVYSQSQCVAYVEAAVLAVDTNRGLGMPTVIDSAMVVSDWRDDLATTAGRKLIAYECEAHVLKVVPDPEQFSPYEEMQMLPSDALFPGDDVFPAEP